MFKRLQDVDLTKDILNSMFLDDLDFVHVLHCIHLLRVFFLHDTHLSVGEHEEQSVFDELCQVMLLVLCLHDLLYQTPLFR